MHDTISHACTILSASNKEMHDKSFKDISPRQRKDKPKAVQFSSYKRFTFIEEIYRIEHAIGTIGFGQIHVFFAYS